VLVADFNNSKQQTFMSLESLDSAKTTKAATTRDDTMILEIMTKISESLQMDLKQESLIAITDLVQAGLTPEQIVTIVMAAASQTTMIHNNF
jgi:hypothetical protein